MCAIQLLVSAVARFSSMPECVHNTVDTRSNQIVCQVKTRGTVFNREGETIETRYGLAQRSESCCGPEALSGGVEMRCARPAS